MNKSINSDALNLLKQLVSIPSISGDEALVSGFLEKWLHARGYSAEKYHNNIWVRSVIDPAYPVILLNSHMDTVKAVSGWTKDPFIPQEEDGRLYGLGVSDAGGSLVALIFAFLKLSEMEDRKFNLVLLISAEEENSGSNGIESALQKIGKVDLALVGEPTNLEMAICERGLIVVDCVAKGVSGHIAHNDGINAITLAMEDIQRLKSIEFSKMSEYLGSVQAEVTMINAGYQHNVIPDECHFVIDVRTNEHYTNEEIMKILKRNMKSEVKARSLRLRSSFIDPQNPLVKKAESLGIKTFGSRTMSDQALIPAPSVKIGPGHSRLSHKADEYIETEKVYQAIDLYINLLKDYNKE